MIELGVWLVRHMLSPASQLHRISHMLQGPRLATCRFGVLDLPGKLQERWLEALALASYGFIVCRTSFVRSIFVRGASRTFMQENLRSPCHIVMADQ